MGFAAGIHGHPLRWHGADLPPVRCGREQATGNRVTNHPSPHRPDEATFEDHLAKREPAIRLGDNEPHARTADLARIGCELERDHAERGVTPQVFEEAGEGGRRAVRLKAVERFVGFERHQLAADDLLKAYRIAWLARRAGATDHEVAIVVQYPGSVIGF